VTLFARLRSLAAGVLRRQRVETSLSEEIRFHVDSYRTTWCARIEFGGVEAYKEQCREARGLRLLDDLRGDLRYAARTLAGSPSFCITAVLTLALGIGANTGLFTLVDTLLLKPTPVRDPQSLYQILGRGTNRVTIGLFSAREYNDVLAGNSVFAQVIADSAVRARSQGRSLGGYRCPGITSRIWAAAWLSGARFCRTMSCRQRRPSSFWGTPPGGNNGMATPAHLQ